MKVTTLRLPESMYDALEAEAEAEEKSVSEYIRGILRDRENTPSEYDPNTSIEYDERPHPLADRVGDLEERVTELESRNESPLEDPPTTPPNTPAPLTELPTEDTSPEREDSSPTAISPSPSLEQIDVPGDEEKVELRREAVRAALGYIQEKGHATPSDLREHVYPDHKAGYTVGKDPARSWWKNCVYPALRELAEGDIPLKKADTTGVWSYPDEENTVVYDPTSEFD